MFIVDKTELSNCFLHEFSITGSTYAPEGQMWVSVLAGYFSQSTIAFYVQHMFNSIVFSHWFHDKFKPTNSTESRHFIFQVFAEEVGGRLLGGRMLLQVTVCVVQWVQCFVGTYNCVVSVGYWVGASPATVLLSPRRGSMVVIQSEHLARNKLCLSCGVAALCDAVTLWVTFPCVVSSFQTERRQTRPVWRLRWPCRTGHHLFHVQRFFTGLQWGHLQVINMFLWRLNAPAANTALCIFSLLELTKSVLFSSSGANFTPMHHVLLWFGLLFTPLCHHHGIMGNLLRETERESVKKDLPKSQTNCSCSVDDLFSFASFVYFWMKSQNVR